MLLAAALGGWEDQKKSLLFCPFPAQELIVQQYLLKKQRRKSLFALSPEIPVATLFGGSVLFYFFFFPSPRPELQEVKVAVPGTYDMENQHRGRGGSLALLPFMSG